MIHHIETLLRRYDFVIVPGLGGFVYQYQSAVITKDTIEPPVVVVSFNPLMNVSDGLLAIETSRMEGISFREASVKITQKVEKILTLLNGRKNVEIGSLGSLQTSEEGKIIFTPSASGHSVPANFGLSTLHYSPAQPLVEPKVITFAMPPMRKITQYAAVGIVAVGLFFAAPQLNNATKNLANLLPSKQAKIEVENTVSPEPLKIVIPKSDYQVKAATTETSELTHHVIVSCMATLKDAEAYQEWLKSLNYQHARILPPVKTYRIAIESFTTKEEAIVYMQELRNSKPQFADAWVLSDSGK